MGRAEGKVAFITGAARGQGRSHAVRLAEEGADIIAVDICEPLPTVTYPMPTEEDLKETARLVEAAGRRVVAVKADVREHARLEEIVAEGVDELGRLDIVVANAGIASLGGVTDVSSEAWQEVVDINEIGVWATCKAAVPHMIEGGNGGAIVLTSSVAGQHAFEGLIHYVTAKHGVVGLMRALARELGPHMIRVNSVHPTQVDTPMALNEVNYRAFAPDVENPGREHFAPISQSMHVMPVPWVEPIDITNAVLFLVSDDARYVTGVQLAVDLGADVIG